MQDKILPKDVHVFSPLFIRKQSKTERDQEIEVLKQFIGEIAKEIEAGVFEEFVLINDGSDAEVKEQLSNLQQKYDWLKVTTNEKNTGLAKTVFNTCQSLLQKHEHGIIMRLDSDGEHDPKMIAELVRKIAAGSDGAISQIRYRPEHQDEMDRLFNNYAGFMQGRVIFGEPLLHNCPGFWAYRIDVMRKMMHQLPEYTAKYRELFREEYSGFNDIGLMFLAVRSGAKIDRTTFHDSRLKAPNRGIDKILAQSLKHTKELKLMLELVPERRKILSL